MLPNISGCSYPSGRLIYAVLLADLSWCFNSLRKRKALKHIEKINSLNLNIGGKSNGMHQTVGDGHTNRLLISNLGGFANMARHSGNRRYLFFFLTNHLSSRHVKMHEKPQNIYFSNVVVVRCKEENVLDHSRRVESGPHCQWDYEVKRELK